MVACFISVAPFVAPFQLQTIGKLHLRDAKINLSSCAALNIARHSAPLQMLQKARTANCISSEMQESTQQKVAPVDQAEYIFDILAPNVAQNAVNPIKS